jgi:hypothetical protein
MVPFVAAPSAAGRAYAGGALSLDISGVGPLYVKSIEGGNAVQTPTMRGARADKYPDKAPGAVRFEDVAVEVPLSQSSAFWDWVNAFSSPNPVPPKTITAVMFDYNYTEKSRRVFDNSVITAFELPTLDSGAKDPGYFKLRYAVGETKENAGTAGAKATPGADSNAKWSTCNFKVTIDGLATTRVAKIDPIVIKRSTKGPLEYSNITLAFSDVDADSWKAWSSQSISGKPVEKNGTIELMAPNFTKTLLTIRLEGLGIVRLFAEPAEANSSQIARSKAELYVEKITFSPSPG